MTRDDFADLHTARLVVRRLYAADASALVAYRSRPDVARFQSWSSFEEADARAFLAAQAGMRPGEPGTWFQVALVDAGSGEVIGDCGLHFLADDHRQVEVGVTLHPAHQGRGMAAEALSALLDYLFVTLGKHRVIAVTDAENRAAAKLFDRLGFRREAHFVENIWFKGAYGSEYLFAMLRREWAGRRKG